MYYVLNIIWDQEGMFSPNEKDKQQAQQFVDSYKDIDRMLDDTCAVFETDVLICRFGNEDINKLESILKDYTSKEGEDRIYTRGTCVKNVELHFFKDKKQAESSEIYRKKFS